MIKPEELKYNLIARSNTDMLKGVIPEPLRYAIRKDKRTYCMAAYDDTDIYCLVVFYLLDDTVFIKYIETSELVYRQGIGTATLQAALSFAKEVGITTVQARVGDNYPDLMDFFEANGFASEDFFLETYFKVDDVKNGKMFSIFEARQERLENKPAKTVFADEGIFRLNQVQMNKVLEYADYLDENDLYHNTLNPNVDRQCSMVYLKDGKIIGCVLIGFLDGALSIQYANTEDITDKKIVVDLFYRTYMNAAVSYPGDTPVYVMTINDEAQSLINKLVPQPEMQTKKYIYEKSI